MMNSALELMCFSCRYYIIWQEDQIFREICNENLNDKGNGRVSIYEVGLYFNIFYFNTSASCHWCACCFLMKEH